MMNTEPIFLFATAAGGPVPATLHRQMTADQVMAAELSWRPLRRTAPGQHAHWDWVFKLGRYTTADVRFVGVECGGEWQGLMLIREYGRSARLPSEVGLPLVFVEYLESAPWSSHDPTRPPRYRGVGKRLLQEAVETSLRVGVSGRIALHSLAQSVGYYEHVAGLIPLGPDPGYNGMAYFELPAADVPAFLLRVKS
jgi:hypothetical protein